jgi:hypothetical protein
MIELLLAIFLVSGFVAAISIFLPRAAKSSNINRQMWVANNLANSKLQELREKPFAVLPLTASTAFGSVTQCDCKNANVFASWPTTDTDDRAKVVQVGTVRYTIQWCTHEVQDNWASQCPNPNAPTGYRNIRVRVFWRPTSGSTQIKSVETEGVLTRLSL